MVDRLVGAGRRRCRPAPRARPAWPTRWRSSRSALYLYESGPTGNGPAPTVIANSTGCSSVYASTMPFSPYLDPWVNGLFQDAQPLAVGIYEGLVSGLVEEVRALRVATMELEGTYDPTIHDAALKTLSWRDFTPAERALVPVVVTISGDGAAFDIGFGAMSRVLAAGTPIKSLVLDTGGYSNTGGQASTATYTGQDADLARYGSSHGGKQESRKELGLLAAFHPNVYVCSTSTAYHRHFLLASGEMLGYDQGASLMVVYTPCDTENGHPGGPGQRPVAAGRGQPGQRRCSSTTRARAARSPSGSASTATASRRACG